MLSYFILIVSPDFARYDKIIVLTTTILLNEIIKFDFFVI